MNLQESTTINKNTQNKTNKITPNPIFKNPAQAPIQTNEIKKTKIRV